MKKYLLITILLLQLINSSGCVNSDGNNDTNASSNDNSDSKSTVAEGSTLTAEESKPSLFEHVNKNIAVVTTDNVIGDVTAYRGTPNFTETTLDFLTKSDVDDTADIDQLSESGSS